MNKLLCSCRQISVEHAATSEGMPSATGLLSVLELAVFCNELWCVVRGYHMAVFISALCQALC